MKKEDFYLNLLLKILKNEKRKFYNFRKDNSTFLYFTCEQTNFIQRTHTNKIHQIHPLNGTTNVPHSLKQKTPTFLTFRNFQTYQHLDSRSSREIARLDFTTSRFRS